MPLCVCRCGVCVAYEFLRSIGCPDDEDSLLARRRSSVQLNKELSLDATTGFVLTLLALTQKRVDLVLEKQQHLAGVVKEKKQPPEGEGAGVGGGAGGREGSQSATVP